MKRPRFTAANGAGPVHIVQPAGRGWDAACFRRLTGRRVELYDGRHALTAWQAGPRCADCATLLRRGRGALLTITGWR